MPPIAFDIYTSTLNKILYGPQPRPTPWARAQLNAFQFRRYAICTRTCRKPARPRLTTDQLPPASFRVVVVSSISAVNHMPTVLLSVDVTNVSVGR